MPLSHLPLHRNDGKAGMSNNDSGGPTSGTHNLNIVCLLVISIKATKIDMQNNKNK